MFETKTVINGKFGRWERCEEGKVIGFDDANVLMRPSDIIYYKLIDGKIHQKLSDWQNVDSVLCDELKAECMAAFELFASEEKQDAPNVGMLIYETYNEHIFHSASGVWGFSDESVRFVLEFEHEKLKVRTANNHQILFVITKDYYITGAFPELAPRVLKAMLNDLNGQLKKLQAAINIASGNLK